MKVKEVMSLNPITLSTNCTLKDGAEIFSSSHIDSAPVVDDQYRLVGIFTKNHLFNAIKEGKDPDTSIPEIMSVDIPYINEDENANVIFDKAEEKFPVVNNMNRLVGFLTKTDLLKAYYKKLEYTINNINAILSSTNNGIIAIDTNSKITLFNKSASEMLGIPIEDAIGKDIHGVIEDSSLPEILTSGRKEVGESFYYNGKRMISNRSPILNNDKIIGAVAIFQDITDYENLLEELNQQKDVTKVLNTILEIAYDGIVVVDRQGYITMMSKAYTKFLGVDHGEVIGKHVTDVIENTRMVSVMETGEPDVASPQKIKGNYMIVSRYPIIENGKVTGAVGKVLFRNVEELNILYKRISKMEDELEHYRGEIIDANRAYYSLEDIIGRDREIINTKKMAEKAAYTHSNVLILGESGTGKELFAHAIHKKSDRAPFPFVKVNCAAIPNELLESELFGYESGAFTGAHRKGKMGKFELADGGTIFLDEIGDMSLHMQAKLLRVLQEKEIEKIGSTITKKLDIRIIAATNQDLEALVSSGKFRADLFYRLNVVTINIPPLRNRLDDIELLTYHLVDKICNRLGKYIKHVSDEALMYLKNYDWPGNIRELENVLERAINILDKEVIIEARHLPKEITGRLINGELKPLRDVVAHAEALAIKDALRMSKGNKSKACRALGISRAALYDKMEKYNI